MLFALQMDAACLGKRRPPLAIEEGTASTCVELQIATSDIPDILGGGEGEGEVDVVVGEVPLVSPAAAAAAAAPGFEPDVAAMHAAKKPWSLYLTSQCIERRGKKKERSIMKNNNR